MLTGKIIDLSPEIYQGMPVYPGHLKAVMWTHLSHEECRRQRDDKVCHRQHPLRTDGNSG